MMILYILHFTAYTIFSKQNLIFMCEELESILEKYTIKLLSCREILMCPSFHSLL